MDSMKNLTWQFDAKGLLRQCTSDEATIEVNSNGVKSHLISILIY